MEETGMRVLKPKRIQYEKYRSDHFYIVFRRESRERQIERLARRRCWVWPKELADWVYEFQEVTHCDIVIPVACTGKNCEWHVKKDSEEDLYRNAIAMRENDERLCQPRYDTDECHTGKLHMLKIMASELGFNWRIDFMFNSAPAADSISRVRKAFNWMFCVKRIPPQHQVRYTVF